MANTPITKVTLGVLKTSTGIVCTNPDVKLIGYPNVYVNCIDTAKGIYEVQLPDNEEIKCLIFSASCGKDCRNCDAQIIKKCFCDDNGDCPPCNVCGPDGFCEPLCDPELCLDGKCVDCTDDKHCPCNQKCNDNGDCQCSSGTHTCPEDPNCCYECCNDSECGPCEVCNGNGECVPKDCEDACDPATGECVDCVTDDQCGVNECCDSVTKTCDCCPGFVRNICTGECVELPTSPCRTTDDCDLCESCTNYDPCTGYGSCTPANCPTGFIAVEINGVCQCIEECDCDDGDCSEDTDFCKDFNDPGCGCVPCEGTCEEGCVAPCYCNPQTNQCEFNPCIDKPCDNGLDCGEGCGCDPSTKTCVPCDSLDCTTNECDNVLGCECNNQNICTESNGCNDAPCSIGSDCPFGCGCVEGICVSCDNFPCVPDDCSTRDGCACVGGNCEGDPNGPNGSDGDDDGCDDTLELEKDDSSCTLIGRLIKDNCCQCPKMTLDSKGKLNSENNTTYDLSFIAEVRKGAFNGVSVNSVPRVDQFSLETIAKNEPPIAGSIQMSYVVKYDVYDISGGGKRFIGTTISSPITTTASFPSYDFVNIPEPPPGKAQVSFNNILLPKINSEVSDGTELSVVDEVVIQFSLINTLTFPNDCKYQGGIFSEYIISNNNQYNSFGSTFGNGKGGVISSSECRKPYFKWTKSPDPDFNESPFRKVYVSGGPTYEDILDDFENDQLESCYYYLLESDCTCDEPPSDYIVFCSPENLDFTLTPSTCPTKLKINSFEPCEVNEPLVYRVQAGSIDVTFTKDTVPTETITSSEVIEEVIYSIVCDEIGECTKTYDVEGINLEISETTECVDDGENFIVTFPSRDDGDQCNVTKVEIGSGGARTAILYTLTGNLSKELPFGKYKAIVYWDCGCDPTEFFFQEDCCNFILSPITRNCDGDINCLQDPSVQYIVNGGVVEDICGFLETVPDSTSVTITATKGDCLPITITLPSLDSFCCENFELVVNQFSASAALVSLIGGSDQTVVTAFNNTTNSAETVFDNGNKTYTITGFGSGNNITVSATDPNCPDTDVNFTTGYSRSRNTLCTVNVELEEFVDEGNTRIQAVADGSTCDCILGSYTVDITNVVNLGSELRVYFTTSLSGFDSIPIQGGLSVGVEGGMEPQGFITGSSSVIVPIQEMLSSDCYSAQIILTLVDDPNVQNLRTLEVKVVQGSTDLIDNPNISFVEVAFDVNGTVHTAVGDSENVYTVSNVAEIGDNISVVIEVKDNDLIVFNGSYSTNSINLGTLLAAVNICASIPNPSASTQVRFEIEDLKFEDNCEYADFVYIYNIYSNGVISPPSPQQIALSPETDDGRFIKFIWVNNGAIIYEEFVGDDDDYTSLLPLALTTLGEEYTVGAVCIPCSDEEILVPCGFPTITVSDNTTCNTTVTVTLTGNPGSYEILYEGVIYSLDLDETGEESIDIGPIVSDTATLRIANVDNCTVDFDIPVITPCVPGISTVCTGPSTYTITITNCGPNPTLQILSGSGSVVGNTVTGVDEADVPSVRVTDSNGCIIDIAAVDLEPDPSCVYTPTYLTPTYTPTYLTPNYTPDTYTPTYLTPNYTPTPYSPTYLTPSYMPSFYPPTYATPSYIPTYYPPTYLTPTYFPTMVYGPSYLTPTYIPTYLTPTPIMPPMCIGCTGKNLGTCCNEISTQSGCEANSIDCIWLASCTCK